MHFSFKIYFLLSHPQICSVTELGICSWSERVIAPFRPDFLKNLTYAELEKPAVEVSDIMIDRVMEITIAELCKSCWINVTAVV